MPGSAFSAGAPLRPATQDAIAAALPSVRRSDGPRRRVRHPDERMARIRGAALIRPLAQSGCVVMQRPPAPAMSASTMPLPNDGGSDSHGRDR